MYIIVESKYYNIYIRRFLQKGIRVVITANRHLVDIPPALERPRGQSARGQETRSSEIQLIHRLPTYDMYNAFRTQNSINYYILWYRKFSHEYNTTVHARHNPQSIISFVSVIVSNAYVRFSRVDIIQFAMALHNILILFYNTPQSQPTIRNSTPRRYLFIFFYEINVCSIAYALVVQYYHYGGTDTSRSRWSEWPTIAAVLVSKITCLHYCTYIVDFSLFGTSIIICILYIWYKVYRSI